jgi:hypothetical protein
MQLETIIATGCLCRARHNCAFPVIVYTGRRRRRTTSISQSTTSRGSRPSHFAPGMGGDCPPKPSGTTPPPEENSSESTRGARKNRAPTPIWPCTAATTTRPMRARAPASAICWPLHRSGRSLPQATGCGSIRTWPAMSASGFSTPIPPLFPAPACPRAPAMPTRCPV